MTSSPQSFCGDDVFYFHLQGRYAVVGVLVQTIADIYGIAVLNIGCHIPLAKGNAGDGKVAVGEIELEVFTEFADTLGITVVDQASGNESRMGIIRTKRFEVTQYIVELLVDILELQFLLHAQDGHLLFVGYMRCYVLFESTLELR